MDDCVILDSTEYEVEWVTDKLGSLFKLMDLEKMSYYMGVSFKPNVNAMFLQKAAYRSRALERFGMHKAKLAPTPMVYNIDNLFEGAIARKFGNDGGRGFLYGELLGSLL